MGSSIHLGSVGGHAWYQMEFGIVSLHSTCSWLCTLASSAENPRDYKQYPSFKHHWKGKHIIEELLSDSTYRVIRLFQLLSTFSTVPRIVLVYFHSGTYILWLEVHFLPEPKLWHQCWYSYLVWESEAGEPLATAIRCVAKSFGIGLLLQ